MPSAVLVSGLASTSLVPGGELDATSRADRTAITPYDLEGVAKGDWSQIAPWLAPDRRTTVVVYLDGVPVDTLCGALEIDEDVTTLTRTCSFSFFGTMASYYSQDSMLRGAPTVQVILTCDDGNSPSTWLAFVGQVQSWYDEGVFDPVANVTAVSISAQLYANSFAGCLQIPAFAGLTRPQIVDLYATSAGTDGDFTALPAAAVVKRPVQLSGITILDLLFRYGELEGWYLREADDGSLECLNETDVLSTVPKFLLTEDLYLSIREDAPNRPTTVLTVAGSEIPDPGILGTDPVVSVITQDGTGSDGQPFRQITTSTKVFGVTVKTVVETWGLYAPKGTTTSSPRLTLTQRITTTQTYQEVATQWTFGLGVYMIPSGQLLKTVVETEGYYSAPATTHPSSALWLDGSHHVDAIERFQLISRVTTENTWAENTAPIPCMLVATKVTTEGWYSLLGGTYSWAFDDGTFRQQTGYVFETIQVVESLFSDNLAEVMSGDTATRVATTTTTTTKPTLVGYDLLTRPHENMVRGVPAVQSLSGTVGADTHWDSGQSGAQIGGIPDPTTAAGDVPQYTLVPDQYTLAAWTDLYPLVTRTDTVQDNESVAELERVARRRARQELGLTLTVDAPMMRTLKCWHTVAVYDSSRGLNGAVGFVTGLKRKLDDVLNGWLGMEMTVVIPPGGV